MKSVGHAGPAGEAAQGFPPQAVPTRKELGEMGVRGARILEGRVLATSWSGRSDSTYNKAGDFFQTLIPTPDPGLR